MCTVTYLPTSKGILLCSSRDEQVARSRAMAPDLYRFAHTRLLFPKDTRAGGSWCVANASGEIGILLNGAFATHIRRAAYRLSRGQVLLQLMQSPQIPAAVQQFNFRDIEPFTLALLERSGLWEFRWDGSKLFQQVLNSRVAHIWSSATLYTPAQQQARRQWFEDWQATQPEPGLRDLLAFHQYQEHGNSDYGLRINRPDGIRTVSITAILHQSPQLKLQYLDLLYQLEFNVEISIPFPANNDTSNLHGTTIALAN